MIETKQEFLTGLKTIIGENTSNEVLDLLEFANKMDTTDNTLQEQISQLTAEKEQLQQEKINLENEWRQRYRDTFFSNTDNKPPEHNNDNVNKNKDGNRKYADLFVSKKE